MLPIRIIEAFDTNKVFPQYLVYMEFQMIQIICYEFFVQYVTFKITLLSIFIVSAAIHGKTDNTVKLFLPKIKV